MDIRPRLIDAGFGQVQIEIGRLHSEIVKRPGCARTSIRTLQQIISGRSTGKPAVLLALADIIGCEPRELISDSDHE